MAQEVQEILRFLLLMSGLSLITGFVCLGVVKCRWNDTQAIERIAPLGLLSAGVFVLASVLFCIRYACA